MYIIGFEPVQPAESKEKIPKAEPTKLPPPFVNKAP